MRNVFRKMLPLLLTLVMLLGAVSTVHGANEPGLQNFTKPNTYSSGDFQDVKESDWFGGVVAEAYAYGLLKGKAPDRFDPNGNVTLAEAVTIAARLHSIYRTGTESFQNGTPWYQPYADYALKEGILKEALKDYNRAATRVEFAHIIRAAFPDKALAQINAMKADAIPDVPSKPDNADIYTLYGAGILTGSDAKGTFLPNSNIRRSEVAAIAVRMVDTTQRKTFTLGLDASADLPATTESKQTVTFRFTNASTNGPVKTRGIALICEFYEGKSTALTKPGWSLYITNNYEPSPISEGIADLPAGKYTMTANVAGYEDKTVDFTVTAGKNTIVSFVLTPDDAVSSDTNAPVFVRPDAFGDLIPLESGRGTLNGGAVKFTIRNGKINWISPSSGISAGIYTLEVISDFTDNYLCVYYKRIENFRVGANLAMPTVTCDRAAEVSFDVRTADGKTPGKIAITIKNGSTTVYQTNDYKKDALYLPVGDYTFTVSCSGYALYEDTLIVSAPMTRTVTLRLPSAATADEASFVYRNHQNKLVPVTSGRGVLMKQDRGPRDYPFTIKDGKFGESTTLPAGAYELEVYEGDTDDNGFTCRASSYTFKLSSSISTGDMILNQVTCDYAAPIRFAVQNDNDKPVDDYQVVIQDASGKTVYSNADRPYADSAFYTYLPRGTYSLRIEAEGYQTYTQSFRVTGTVNDTVRLTSSFVQSENGGTCGDNVYWKIENDTLTIYGNGMMTRYDSNLDYPWANQSGKLSGIVVEDGVQSVESLAFTMSSAETVTFGKDLRFVGYKAFLHCRKLTGVTFTGDAPTVNRNGIMVIAGVNVFDNPVTVYYPKNNSTWTEEAKEAFGDNVTFAAY